MIQTETTELVHVVITDQRVEQRRMTVGVVPIMTMMVVVVAGVSLWIITSLVGKTFDHLVSSQYAEVDSGESTKTTTHQQQQRKYLKQKKKLESYLTQRTHTFIPVTASKKQNVITSPNFVACTCETFLSKKRKGAT